MMLECWTNTFDDVNDDRALFNYFLLLNYTARTVPLVQRYPVPRKCQWIRHYEVPRNNIRLNYIQRWYHCVLHYAVHNDTNDLRLKTEIAGTSFKVQRSHRFKMAMVRKYNTVFLNQLGSGY